MAPAAGIQHSSIAVGLIAVLCAAALALLIARSLTRPIVQLTEAVQGAARDGKAAIPVDAGGETGVLARAFAQVMAEANAKTVALEREVAEHRRTVAARDHHAERERLFSAAVESSSDAIITLSLDGTITGWNSAAERLYGYTAAEAAGQSITILVPTARQTEVQDTLRRIGWGESIEHNETTRLRKDGRPIEVSLSISPIRSPSGATIGISKVARDITDSNKTRLALRQQTEELRRIFETSQDLIMVMDSRGSLVQISPSCEAVLGYRPREMIGRSGADFIHPDHLENARREMRALRGGQRPTIADTRYIHKDGREVRLSWLGTWSEPVKRFFFVGRDMTESRRAQQTLRESEQLARGIIDTALDAFVQMDEQGVISDWNTQAEKIFGWTHAEAVGTRLSELIIPDIHRDAHQAGMERFLRTGEARILGRRFEIEATRRDGKEIKVELSVTELTRRNGFVFNGFMRDLTDRIAAEDRIRQAEKMEAVGQLTGGIAHDFNNILTVITGTIEILADAVKNEPQLAAITRMIDEAATRGADLTQHLLAFARKQPLEPRETDVNALIIDTAKLLQRTLGEHVEIESVFEDESCPAIVDPNQLATAILNLALNARDAMPDGGKLIIETSSVVLDGSYAGTHNDVRPGRYAMIAVSDTGTGIPAADLDKVFNPFFTSKGPGKGTGLGLSMVYGFVKQSAGHIMIYSEEGHGTTIRMYLPPATGTSLAAEPASMASLVGGDETILVVEDDSLVRNYVLTQLHSLGYVTLDAANASRGARDRQCGPSVRPAVHRRDHARPQRPPARQRDSEGQARDEGVVHVGLYRRRDHPPRPARRRRAAAGQAIPQIGYGHHDPKGARRLNAVFLFDAFSLREPVSTSLENARNDHEPSGLSRGGHHDPDQIGGVSRPELLHDIGAMVLDRSRADPEMPSRFLVGGAGGELLEHLAFPARQRFPSGKMHRCDPGRGRVLGLPPGIGLDRLVQSRDDLAAAERLFDEVQRAALDGIDGHRDIALSA